MTVAKLVGITPMIYKIYDSEGSSVLEAYVDLVRRMDCIPILLPSNPNEKECNHFKKTLSGLILQGGGDISPIRSNQNYLEGIGHVNLKQDETDFDYLQIAVENKIPVFGICRGMQIINVFFGGTLYQDVRYLKREKDLSIMHDSNDDGTSLVHRVSVSNVKGKHSQFKNNSFWVNSLHHEFIEQLGEGLIVTLTSDDGVIEGIEYENIDSTITGVQFHPEILLRQNHSDAIRLVEGFKNQVFSYSTVVM